MFVFKVNKYYRSSESSKLKTIINLIDSVVSEKGYYFNNYLLNKQIIISDIIISLKDLQDIIEYREEISSIKVACNFDCPDQNNTVALLNKFVVDTDHLENLWSVIQTSNLKMRYKIDKSLINFSKINSVIVDESISSLKILNLLAKTQITFNQFSFIAETSDYFENIPDLALLKNRVIVFNYELKHPHDITDKSLQYIKEIKSKVLNFSRLPWSSSYNSSLK